MTTTPRRRTGIAALVGAGEDGEFSVIEAIGGPRGVVESILPGLVFVVLFVCAGDLRLTVIVSAILAVLQVLVRLIQRQSVMGAVSGLLSVGICLVWAWTSHEARNYYMVGFINNAVCIVLLAVSLAVRVPGVGLVVELIRSMPASGLRSWLREWRSDRALYRAYAAVSVLWIGVFGLRLAVQVPLYLSDRVGLLGTARLLMGLPFWALALWVSMLMLATPVRRHIVAARELSADAAPYPVAGETEGAATLEGTATPECTATLGRTATCDDLVEGSGVGQSDGAIASRGEAQAVATDGRDDGLNR